MEARLNAVPARNVLRFMFHLFHYMGIPITSIDIPREEASLQDSWFKIKGFVIH